MKAEDFDKKFEEGQDISEHLDISKATRAGQEQQRVNVDFPLEQQQKNSGRKQIKL